MSINFRIGQYFFNKMQLEKQLVVEKYDVGKNSLPTSFFVAAIVTLRD
jgi:hypothetical protein